MKPVAAEAWSFQPEPSSTREARRRVSEILEESQVDTSGTCALVVSELATNAVLHARTVFEVRLLVDRDVVRIEVHDRIARLPTRRYFSNEALSGRGLRLVEELSVEWGVEADADGGGKTVWAEVSTGGTPPAQPVFDLDAVEDW